MLLLCLNTVDKLSRKTASPNECGCDAEEVREAYAVPGIEPFGESVCAAFGRWRDEPQRKRTLLKGETKRRRLGIAMFLGEVG
jgi:hypothetical protein